MGRTVWHIVSAKDMENITLPWRTVLAMMLLSLLMLVGCANGERSGGNTDATPPATATTAGLETKAETAKATISHVRPSVEALSSPIPLLAPLSTKAAATQVAALQKDRQGLRSWTDLAPALQRSLDYARSWPQDERAIEHSGMRVNWSRITQSLELLLSLLPRLDKDPQLLSRSFQWLHMTPQTHFTAYYSPVIKASRTREEGYTYPIYRLPEELAPGLAHCLPSHSCPEEAFAQVIRPETPYHSRAAIDLDGALAGRGLEMAWMAHPFDTYTLMLQGSGLLEFDDGTSQTALFAGLNGARGQSMAGYLIRQKEVPRKDATMDGLRRWWDKNPQKRRAFLNAAKGYAFFRFGAAKPRGTAGGELTPWVSMAVDDRVLPLAGILAYALPTRGAVKAGTAGGNNSTLQGLGFAHDTGSAIKMRRIDLYAGEGQQGHDQAMSVYTKGQIWLLLAR